MRCLDTMDKRGWLYFCGLVICVLSFFTTPDGLTLFHGFLGLFGISPGIPLGNGSLYIFMFIPLITGIFCARKVYNLRHHDAIRIAASIGLVVFVILSSITPSVIDHLYFSAISRQSGLRAISFYQPSGNLSVNIQGYGRTYYYTLRLHNHSRDVQHFNVMLIYREWFGEVEEQDVLIRDANGEVKTFTIPPQQTFQFSGEFSDYNEIPMSMWGMGYHFNIIFDIILATDNEQHRPVFLARRPV